MDQTYEYLWAAGYDLPPETPKVLSTEVAEGLVAYEVAPPPPKRRGKKAARAKRERTPN
jgi:hypothetical protein